MTNYATVEKAVSLVVENLEANYITCNTDCIRDRVYSWYNNSDVTDPEVLAACALTGENWHPGVTYQDMLDAKEWWFPQNPYDNIAIWEIEDALRDAMWW